MTHFTNLGVGGSAKRCRYSIKLFSKMGDNCKGGVKNLKKWLMSFMDCPNNNHTLSKHNKMEVYILNFFFHQDKNFSKFL